MILKIIQFESIGKNIIVTFCNYLILKAKECLECW